MVIQCCVCHFLLVTNTEIHWSFILHRFQVSRCIREMFAFECRYPFKALFSPRHTTRHHNVGRNFGSWTDNVKRQCRYPEPARYCRPTVTGGVSRAFLSGPNLWVGLISGNHNNSATSRFFWLHSTFCHRQYESKFKPCLRKWPKATEFDKNNATQRPLRRSRSFKDTTFGDNEKPMSIPISK